MRSKNKDIKVAKSRGIFKMPWLTMFISAFVIWLFIVGPDRNEVFVFNKFEIYDGSLWRLFTGQLIHNNFDHLFWDLLGFIVLGGIIESYSKAGFTVSMVFSAAAVSFWMFMAERDFAIYYGLSGLLNGLLVVAVVIKRKETGNNLYLWVLVVTAAKMIYEIATKSVFFIDPSIPTIPGTHAAGFFAGIIVVVVFENRLRIKNKLSCNCKY
jgi:rhomboid family GlyGly-CTERM serine protease